MSTPVLRGKCLVVICSVRCGAIMRSWAHCTTVGQIYHRRYPFRHRQSARCKENGLAFLCGTFSVSADWSKDLQGLSRVRIRTSAIFRLPLVIKLSAWSKRHALPTELTLSGWGDRTPALSWRPVYGTLAVLSGIPVEITSAAPHGHQEPIAWDKTCIIEGFNTLNNYNFVDTLSWNCSPAPHRLSCFPIKNRLLWTSRRHKYTHCIVTQYSKKPSIHTRYGVTQNRTPQRWFLNSSYLLIQVVSLSRSLLLQSFLMCFQACPLCNHTELTLSIAFWLRFRYSYAIKRC